MAAVVDPVSPHANADVRQRYARRRIDAGAYDVVRKADGHRVGFVVLVSRRVTDGFGTYWLHWWGGAHKPSDDLTIPLKDRDLLEAAIADVIEAAEAWPAKAR
jgi:hypothetical protein